MLLELDKFMMERNFSARSGQRRAGYAYAGVELVHDLLPSKPGNAMSELGEFFI